ncbi:PREDICTED: MATH domain and coiled-coil domain-containing protein At3g58260-like [Camelina sativa]|uniref:MATH domain and coiled-coil domain-containing protein At3g58260-like n=1 Tax=Camelina sativa TaxID=90675 RepID=A0ABM0YRD6_CAMSA|nr:PREDICTED: MATH domain and coiled-coil domain-containing protein At3g58260-like [Camelina sativa]
MGKQVDNTFTCVIKNFSLMQAHIASFVVGGCKWRLIAYPEVNHVGDCLSLSVCLDVPDCDSLPSGWKRHAKISLTLVNQYSEERSLQQEKQQCFNQKTPRWGFLPMVILKVPSEEYGFLVNDEIVIVVAVDVLEVIGSLDESEKSQSIDVKGFQVLPSQVKYVNCLFERHPDIASKFSIKNQTLKTAYMNVLLSLTETLNQSPKEISKDDLSDAKTTLAYMKNVGFKVDWLENKLDELFKKEKEAGVIRMLKIEEEFKDLKQKCSSLEVLLKKEKADVLAARAPFSLFDKDDDLIKWLSLLMICIMVIAFI